MTNNTDDAIDLSGSVEENIFALGRIGPVLTRLDLTASFGELELLGPQGNEVWQAQKRFVNFKPVISNCDAHQSLIFFIIY
jgi:hypothetical protein